jgi:glutaconyl-CoA/methylmalonyl-CoA decarboxylase subunit gamma
MKYTVQIANKSYEVEIEDILARPVVAYIDGERFEVQPENKHESVTKKERKPKEFEVSGVLPVHSESLMANTGELTAPLPGTVVEVFVKAGEQVEVGKVVLIIEAMKMKNSIRSTRTGKIAEVLVNAGQTVAHKQALVRFE